MKSAFFRCLDAIKQRGRAVKDEPEFAALYGRLSWHQRENINYKLAKAPAAAPTPKPANRKSPTTFTGVLQCKLRKLFRHRGYADVEERIAAIDAKCALGQWVDHELGEEIGLTADEKIMFGMPGVRCLSEAEDAKVAAHRQERKLNRQREQRGKRREERMLHHVSKAVAQAEAVLAAIKPDEEVSTPIICIRIAKAPAFRKIEPASRPRIVRMILNDLTEKRVLEMRRDDTDRGRGSAVISVKIRKGKRGKGEKTRSTITEGPFDGHNLHQLKVLV